MENLQDTSEMKPKTGFVRVKKMLASAARTAAWVSRGMPEQGRQQPRSGSGWHFPDSDVPTPYDTPYLRELMEESPDGIVDIERIFTGESTD